MNKEKSSWSVNYEKTYPIITLVDVVGKVEVIDVNQIVELAQAKVVLRCFKLLEEKSK